MDYRDTPTARPTSEEIQCGDVVTPKQAEGLFAAELATRRLQLQWDGDGMGGTAVVVVAL